MKKILLFFISVMAFGILIFCVANLKENALCVDFGGGIYIMDGGEYTFDNNSVITGKGGSSVTAGGGVCVEGGVFMMLNGKITGNSAANGGGVYVEGSGVFYMDGGEISRNSAQTGGGVSVGTGGTFEMSGGSIISNGASVSGGGVWINRNASFVMYNGTIANNTCGSGSGYAIYNLGTFIFSGGNINGSIYTNSTITINKKPIAPFQIEYGGIKVGTTIAKISSGVSDSVSDYNVTNLPSGTHLEIQTVSGYKCVVVVEDSFDILIVSNIEGAITSQIATLPYVMKVTGGTVSASGTTLNFSSATIRTFSIQVNSGYVADGGWYVDTNYDGYCASNVGTQLSGTYQITSEIALVYKVKKSSSCQVRFSSQGRIPSGTYAAGFSTKSSTDYGALDSSTVATVSNGSVLKLYSDKVTIQYGSTTTTYYVVYPQTVVSTSYVFSSCHILDPDSHNYVAGMVVIPGVVWATYTVKTDIFIAYAAKRQYGIGAALPDIERSDGKELEPMKDIKVLAMQDDKQHDFVPYLVPDDNGVIIRRKEK